MKANYTHISMLLDRSSSMSSLLDATISGFNEFLETQKKEPGELTVTLVQFNTEYEVLFDFKNIHEIPHLTTKLYRPDGMTALNDSWVRLIDETGQKLSSLKEEDRPEKVLCISFSDGEENASTKYQGTEGNKFIKDLVEKQETIYSWKFLYVGANQDSKLQGTSKGIKNYMNFRASDGGVHHAFATLSSTSVKYRSAGTNTLNVQVDEVLE